MWDKIKKLFEFSSKNGLYFPGAYDNNTNKSSVSLLFANISFYIACGSVLTLLYKDTTLGTIAAMMLAALYFVFYMLRKLNKAKIDIDDRSLDLENTEGDNDEK